MSHKKNLLIALCSFFACINAIQAGPVVRMTGQNQGRASIEDSSVPYHYVRLRIEAAVQATLTIKQDTAVLVGQDGSRITDCWIQIVGGGAGLSLEKTAPIAIKTLTEASAPASGSAPVLRYNTSKVDGPAGALVYSIPKDGFVELRLFWPVNTGFEAKRVVLANIGEIDLANVVAK